MYSGPVVIKNVFDENTRSMIMKDIATLPDSNLEYQTENSRLVSNSSNFMKYSILLRNVAQEVFCENNLYPSYTLWSRYFGTDAKLSKHKDTNACTFTIDYCVNQFYPWPIVVEGKEYVLETNDAICFMGESEEHWRSEWKTGNIVDMIFMHYVTMDHWWFTGEGGRYA